MTPIDINRYIYVNDDTMNYSDAPAKLDELQASHGFLKCRKNSRAELVPSPRAYARNGASRRWLGENAKFCLVII